MAELGRLDPKRVYDMDMRRQAQISRQKEIIDRLLEGDSAEMINQDQEKIIVDLRAEVERLNAEVRSAAISRHPSSGMYGGVDAHGTARYGLGRG